MCFMLMLAIVIPTKAYFSSSNFRKIGLPLYPLKTFSEVKHWVFALVLCVL